MAGRFPGDFHSVACRKGKVIMLPFMLLILYDNETLPANITEKVCVKQRLELKSL